MAEIDEAKERERCSAYLQAHPEFADYFSFERGWLACAREKAAEVEHLRGGMELLAEQNGRLAAEFERLLTAVRFDLSFSAVEVPIRVLERVKGTVNAAEAAGGKA